MPFESSFQVLAALLSTCYRKQFYGFVRKDFLRVCGMCLSHNWYNLFGFCILYGTWVLVGCVDYIICTTNWFIQISFEFRKWLVFQDLNSKDTKLLSKLPWLSRKQSTIFISSNSNLVFLTFSILFANTEHGSSKQKNLCDTAKIQCGQTRKFLGSSSSVRTEEGGRKNSTNCVCQL